MIEKTLGKILKIGVLLSTTGFIGATVVQIFARFFLPSAPSWTEEASRLFFIYAMSFAAGLAMRDKYYVELDVFYSRFTPKVKGVIDLVILVCTITLFAVMGLYSIQYIQLGAPETSPSMRIPMSYAFFSVLIMSLSVGAYAFLELIKKLNSRK